MFVARAYRPTLRRRAAQPEKTPGPDRQHGRDDAKSCHAQKIPRIGCQKTPLRDATQQMHYCYQTKDRPGGNKISFHKFVSLGKIELRACCPVRRTANFTATKVDCLACCNVEPVKHIAVYKTEKPATCNQPVRAMRATGSGTGAVCSFSSAAAGLDSLKASWQLTKRGWLLL